MTVERLDNVGIVVSDLDAAVAFFEELGLTTEARMEIEGEFADQAVGLDGIRCAVAMMRTPDGHGALELAQYLHPDPIPMAAPNPPHNIIGTHRVMFAVDDIEDTIARLRPLGGEVLREVARFEDAFLLCYLRGPDGIIVGLAQQIG